MNLSMEDRTMDIVGERIMVTRKRQRIAQKDLAVTIGMSQKHLSQIETGIKHGLHLRADAVIRLAQALGVSTDYLLGVQETA
jgi:transcriptional regulator with XRE-family HTH domain